MDMSHFKEKLEAELKQVEEELSGIGTKNTEVKNSVTDWETVPEKMGMQIDTADETEVADRIEEYEENTAVLKNLEIRYNDIKSALKKIENNTYGICEICGKPIEEDRLEANPSAKTCKTHMNG